MQRVGVVLSTGDLRGVFAHTGFLMALEKLGISYQAIAGSSAGAVVAAIVGSGRSVEEFSDWLKALKVEDYWEADSLLTILYHLVIKAGRGYTGIVSTNRLEKTIASIVKTKVFEACPVSLYLIATNLTTGLKEVFHSGEIAPRAAASIAIPTLFKAKRIGDCYYVDGGVYEFTPKSAICCKENLNVLLVNQIKTTLDHIKGDNRFLQEKWSLVPLLGRVLDALYEKERVEREGNMTLCPCGCEARIVTLAPQIDPLDRLEPEKGMQLVQQGYDETLRLLPSLLKKLDEHPINPAPEGRISCD